MKILTVTLIVLVAVAIVLWGVLYYSVRVAREAAGTLPATSGANPSGATSTATNPAATTTSPGFHGPIGAPTMHGPSGPPPNY
jgi:hypothetical protein